MDRARDDRVERPAASVSELLPSTNTTPSTHVLLGVGVSRVLTRKNQNMEMEMIVSPMMPAMSHPYAPGRTRPISLMSAWCEPQTLRAHTTMTGTVRQQAKVRVGVVGDGNEVAGMG